MIVAKVLCTHVWRVDRARQYWLIGFLDLLGTPASVFGLAHVGRGLDGGNELESDVGNTSKTNNATSDLAENAVAYHQGAEEDVKDTTADEGEHERRMSRNLRGDLELKEASNKTKDDHVSTQDDGLTAEEALVLVLLYYGQMPDSSANWRRSASSMELTCTYRLKEKMDTIPPRMTMTPTAKLTMRKMSEGSMFIVS
jgi:hypothetical protein